MKEFFRSLIYRWKAWRGDLIHENELCETLAKVVAGTFLEILGGEIRIRVKPLTDNEAEIFLRSKGVSCTLEVACAPGNESENIIKWVVTRNGVNHEGSFKLIDSKFGIAEICEYFGVPRKKSIEIQEAE